MNYEKNKAAFEDALSIGQKFLESHGKSIISWKLILSIRSLFMTEIRLFYRNNMYYEISEDSLTGDWEHTKQKSVGKVSKLMLSLEKKMIRFVENIQHNQNEFFQADQKEKEKHTMRVLLSDKLVAYQSHKEYDQALVALDEYYSFCDKDNEFTTMYYNFNKARIFHSMKNWKQALLFFKKLKITSKNNPVLKNSQTPLQTELFTLTAMIDCYDMLKDKKNHLRYLKIYNKRKKFLTPAKVRKESLDIGNSKLHKSKSKEVIKIKHPGEEGQRLEFKSSFFIHGNTVKRNNRIVRIVNHRQRVSEEKKGQEDIAATVCSFLNSDGGDVYIGVDDKTKICYGLEREFTRTNNSTDTYTQTVRQTIQSKFREHYTTELTFDFYKHRDPDTNEPIQLYQIHVEPLLDTEKKPCSVKHSEGNEVVYFREGDSDKRFDLMDGTVEWYKRIEINRNRV